MQIAEINTTQPNVLTAPARKLVNHGSKHAPGGLRAASQQVACADALNEEGKTLFAQGQANGAAVRFERAIALLAEACPSHSAAPQAARALQRSCRLNLASCRLAQGRLEDARDCCDRVLALDPSSCKALFRRAAAMTGMARRIRVAGGAGGAGGASMAEQLLGLAMKVCRAHSLNRHGGPRPRPLSCDSRRRNVAHNWRQWSLFERTPRAITSESWTC
jgi:tetratricopeptide (TPR) repeat protein